MFASLKKLNPNARKSHYHHADGWDLKGLREDIAITARQLRFS